MLQIPTALQLTSRPIGGLGLPYLTAYDTSYLACAETTYKLLGANPKKMMVAFAFEATVWPVSCANEWICDFGGTNPGYTSTAGVELTSDEKLYLGVFNNYCYVDLTGAITPNKKYWVFVAWDGDGGLAAGGDPKDSYVHIYINGVRRTIVWGTASTGFTTGANKLTLLNHHRIHYSGVVTNLPYPGLPAFDVKLSEFRLYNVTEIAGVMPDPAPMASYLYNAGLGRRTSVELIAGHESIFIEYLFADLALENPIRTTELIDTSGNGWNSGILEEVEGAPYKPVTTEYLYTMGRLDVGTSTAQLYVSVPGLGVGVTGFTQAGWYIPGEAAPAGTRNCGFNCRFNGYCWPAFWIDAGTGHTWLAFYVGDGPWWGAPAGKRGWGYFNVTSFFKFNIPFFYTLVWDSTGATDADRLKCYINGAQQTAESWSIFSDKIPDMALDFGLAGTGDWYIIGDAGGAAVNLFGKIGQMRFFSEALSPAKIQTLYGAGLGNPDEIKAVAGFENMEIEWLFTEQIGTTVADTSVNMVTLTIVPGNEHRWGGVYRQYEV